MRFNALGEAVRKLKDIGLDAIDISILHRVDSCENVMVKDIMMDLDFASPATLHTRLNKKLIGAKLLRLDVSKEDGRVKYVVKGAKFEKIEKLLKDI